MDDLIARLEKAAGPSRELDAEIAKAVGAPHGPWEHVTVDTRTISYVNEQAASYTASTDAVRYLAEPGVEFTTTNLYGIADVEVGLNMSDALGGTITVRRKDGNLILAECEAWLRLRAALKAQSQT